MKVKNLQYQLSNGSWIDCNDRTMEFLNRCVKTTGKTESQIIENLLSASFVRNDTTDWYSFCRIKPEPKKYKKPEMVKCDCGCVIPKNLVMNNSTGTCCCDCYDEMSY